MSVAFLYPGQGAQRPGVLDHFEREEGVAEVFDRARNHLAHTEFPLERLNNAEALTTTTGSQLAVVVCGIAAADAAALAGIVPDFVAGHSAGAFAAAVTCGVLTLEEALDALLVRGRAMERPDRSGQWGMAAIVGLTSRQLWPLLEQVATASHPLWLANDNAETQLVVSGTRAALAHLTDVVAEHGATRVEILDVAVASHCPIQQDAAAQLRDLLAAVPRREQRCSFLLNVTGRCRRNDSGAVLADLADAVARPVQWRTGVQLLIELGATAWVQMPPGRHLLTMLNLPHPGYKCIAIDDLAAGSRFSQLRRRCGPA